MNSKTILILLVLALAMTACVDESWGTPQASRDPVAMATQQAYLSANYAASAEAQHATGTAAVIQETRRVEERQNGTAEAQQAVANATNAVVNATAYAVSYQSTIQAAGAEAAANKARFNATETVAAAAAIAYQTQVASNAESNRMIVEAEAERLYLANRAEEAKINRAYITLAIVGIVIITLTAGFIMIRLKNASTDATPVVVQTPDYPTILVRDANGWMTTARPALPAPSSRPLPAPDTHRTVTFPPMAKGHVLIAGETGSGKSTAVRAALQRRQNVVVLDPHYKPGSWGNVKVVGAGRDFDSIAIFMEQMRDMLSKRYTARARGQSEFSNITVATDEMPAIITALGNQVGDAWREWLREGRKVGLFFIVSTQSTRVKTLGIEGEGDLLENFAYVLMLGKYAAGKYPNLVVGQERPAVIQTIGGVRPVKVPLIEPSGGGDVIRLSTTNNANGSADSNDTASLIEQYRHQIEATYWQYVHQNGQEPSKRHLCESVIGYSNGRANEAVTEILNQMRPSAVRL